MEIPPIIVAPVDSERHLSKMECDELERRIKDAEPGEVIVLPFAVNLYHNFDGLWIHSEDLAEFQSSPDAPPQAKKEPGESYYTPPIS